MQLLAKHTLTMTPDYVLSWQLWESVRELLQNAIDQHTADPQSKMVFLYDARESLLTVGATNCELERKTLLLGMSNKRSRREAIGQFGEGYKLAMLALTRNSFEVSVRTGSEIWMPKFEYSDEFQSSVLTISIYRAHDHANGVFFDVRDVSEREFGDIAEKYLAGHPLNRVLDEDHLRGKVFVSGLFVCEIEQLKYGYNFSPDRIKLDRDRGMASSFDVAWEASRLWEDHGDDKALYDNLAAGALDTSYVRLARPTTNAYAVERYLTETPEAIPVATDEEAQRLLNTGHKVRLVPAALRDLLRRMHKFCFNREGTPCERLERFSQQFGHRLDADGKRELEAILEASKWWTGPADGYNEDEERPIEE